MKKSKSKVLAMLLCAVMLVGVTVVGTLAYLTDEEEVVNTFTVGQVDLVLDEADVDEDGQIIMEGEEPAERVKGNEYHLIPGQTYVKDPTVTVVKGSEEAYVRMLVTINEYKELKAIFGNDFLPQDYVSGWDDAVWVSTKVVKEDTEANTVTYEFRYFKTVDASEAAEDIVLEALFDSITVPGEITGEQLKTIQNLKISVVGHAIQVSGFDTADAAWTAFDEQVAGM